MIKMMPKLSPQDVCDAVIYAISTPENVLVIIHFDLHFVWVGWVLKKVAVCC